MITAVGLNLSIDRTIEVDRLVPYGTNRALSARSDAGGKAVNVALMAARLGAETAVAGFMREGSAAFFEEKLRAGGVATDFVALPGQVRVNVKVFDREARAVTEFNEAGEAVSGEDLKRLVDRVRQHAARGGWLVLTGSLPPGCPKDFYLRLIEAAPGCRVALDADGEALSRALAIDPASSFAPSGDPTASRAVPPRPFLVKPNRRELEGLVGRRLDSIQDVRLGAMELIDRGVQMAVVSLGEEGALMVSREACLFAEPANVAVRSTVGAGDAMVAGLVAGLEAGKSMETAFRMGVAAAGAAVATEGTQAASPEAYKQIFETISIQKVM